ncbi:hypothetical protein [Methylocaldum sp. GT1TLB]|uniref:hypothetical protein n=1 Tax=Methylocaldum sp. GT1TLB TaxID=3438965 RepID=UPI003DA0CE6C
MEDERLGQVTLSVPPRQIAIAYITRQRYAELSGVPIGIVDAWVDRGHIPSELIGKHRLVNVALLWSTRMPIRLPKMHLISRI